MLSRVLIILLIISSISQAQLDEEPKRESKSEIGFVFTMAESGSGVGGFIAWPLIGGFHLGFNLDAYFLRDSKQIDGYDYIYNMPYSLNKENNVYLFDAMITLKKRLFADDLDDSFRPFITGGFGPYYGLNFPEDIPDPEGNMPKDEYEFTVGGFAGVGVDVVVNEKTFVGIRGQYRVIPFSNAVGERSNHSMFELRFEIGRMF